MQHKRVIALGFFDGVHLGHAALLRQARVEADRLGCAAAVMTFDNHPSALLQDAPVPLLSSPEDRADCMRRLYGIDEVIISHFDRAMLEMPWRDFVENYLCRELGAVHVVCGHDFHFGYRGEGNPDRLRKLCGELHIGCSVIEKVTRDGITVSSSYIRELLQAGDLERANAFLGHRHAIGGAVIHGRQLGRTLGSPTANILLPPQVLSPAFGVYATLVATPDASYAAVTNVGVRPTVDGSDQITIEPWILDFEGDLYGQKIRVEFCKFLRPERKFESLAHLQTAISHNAQQTRNYFSACKTQ